MAMHYIYSIQRRPKFAAKMNCLSGIAATKFVKNSLMHFNFATFFINLTLSRPTRNEYFCDIMKLLIDTNVVVLTHN